VVGRGCERGCGTAIAVAEPDTIFTAHCHGIARPKRNDNPGSDSDA
jgi:hypothetical protein